MSNEKGGAQVPGKASLGHNEDEPNWIRDTQAAPMVLNIPAGTDVEETIAKLCEGEHYHCELCGAEFALWPLRVFASHALKDHAADYTVQALATFSLMCLEQIGQAHQMFLMAQVHSRVSMRRRGRELGLWEPAGRIIPGARQ